ncbi:hypothetical protein V2A60_009256 [Cordyceps javanica]|uniref:Uncharacterized protein n=1 Tax=Cordyceps javanica TaxID=43265 RepID=A0A545UTK8_9HYPO|nr:hypothetical protein IF1G_08720 [Cordyceps javanica]TQW02112.1 hypothetical protein IF2G_10317 [Cordyceps javanica]
MALFPLEIDEPVRRPQQPGQNHLLLGAGLAMSIVYFWGPFAVMAVNDTLPPRHLVGLATIVISLVFFLQTFLLYRLLSQARACPAVTDPVDAFFYESRAGSSLLLSLCVPWCVMGAYGLILSLPAAAETIAHHGNSGSDGHLGHPLELLFAFIMITTPAALCTGIWWASRTALRALYRILRTDIGRGQYEGVPLGLYEPGPDQRQFQGNMRPDNRSRAKATLIFGVLPTPSWLA